MSAHLTEPACIWRDRRTPPHAATHAVHPGDQVTLCTAQATWTVDAVHNEDDTATLAPRDQWTTPMRVHQAHLDPAETAEVDGQLSIFDALEA